MSRSYEMRVEISGYNPKKQAAIVAAAEKEWPFKKDDWCINGGTMEASTTDSLYGGESEDEFAERLSVAIWRANEGYCKIVVDAAYLELPPPVETHVLDEDDFARLLEEKSNPSEDLPRC